MSDHGSGPRALTDPAADLTDVFAFPAPGNPRHIVVVMDVFSRAGPSAVFSDAVIYRFRFRRVRIAATGPGAAFAVGDDEATFDFTFDVPEGSDTMHPLQRGHCRTPSGEMVSFHVNDEKGASGSGVQRLCGPALRSLLSQRESDREDYRDRADCVRKGRIRHALRDECSVDRPRARMGEAARWRPDVRHRLRNVAGRSATGPLRTARPTRDQERYSEREDCSTGSTAIWRSVTSTTARTPSR